MRNRTEHGFSRLTVISDAGSTPAASISNYFIINSLQATIVDFSKNIANVKSRRISEIDFADSRS